MLTLQVPSMSCTHCEQKVTKAIRAVDPAAKVSIELSAKTVRVESVVADEKLRDAIRSAGYPIS